MANRYWVGGGGTWDSSSTTHWSATSGGSSGASAPTYSDDVFINSSSGTVQIVITNGICRSINCTGFTGILSGYLTQMAGNITLSSGGTYSYLYIYTQGSLTFTSAGASISNLELSTAGSAYTVTCADALSCYAIILSENTTLKIKDGVTSYLESITTPYSGTPATLQSTSNGSRATLSGSSGTNTLDYVSVKDIAFTGGASWVLGSNGTDAGNNTGLTTPSSASSISPLFTQSLA